MVIEIRELRGLEIASRSPITRQGDLFVVPSQFGPPVEYEVTLDPITCTCPDFASIQAPCEHFFAAKFAEAAAGGASLPPAEYPRSVPDGAPDWVTPELIHETIRVFQFFYPQRLTADDALEMILNVARIFFLG